MKLFRKMSKQEQIDKLRVDLYDIHKDMERLNKCMENLSRDQRNDRHYIADLNQTIDKIMEILEHYIPGKITFVSLALNGDITNECHDGETFIYKDGKEYKIENLYLAADTVLTVSPTQNHVVAGTNKEGTVYINLNTGVYIWTERNQVKENGDK